MDNDIGTRKIVRDCITQNTLCHFLGMAKLSEPVPIQTMRVNKTEKMQIVDAMLRSKYINSIEARSERLRVKDKEQRDILERSSKIKASIVEREL